MKNLKMRRLAVVAAIIITIFAACNKEDHYAQWYGIGTIVKADTTLDDFIITLDDGSELRPNRTIVDNSYKDGDRVLAYYAITNSLGNHVFEVDLFDIDKILTKDIIQLTEAIQDSIGNDPVYLGSNDVWKSDKYLNFIFKYYGGYKSHYINLVKLYENTHTEDGRLILEFRHNANDDYSAVLMNGVVSFNLESLREEGQDSVQFLVRVKRFDQEDLEWEGSYVFDNSLKSAKENNLSRNYLPGVSSDHLK